MSDKSDAVQNNDLSWDSMVRLSAAILNRDFGSRSRQEALRRADECGFEDNERGKLFWTEVADVIINNNLKYM
ncbi:hypothetical protein [Bosea sp. (in: a-proteobacteria)]|jgi:hypothetical protein|uniref:hypothetical protein n=1 Tax=Bosea sp. (in: a-proteobacteria) TaxID=1871050 RepID=UPI003568C962